MGNRSAAPTNSGHCPILPKLFILAMRALLGAWCFLSAFHLVHFNGQWHFGDYYFYLALRIDSYDLFPLWAVESIAVVLPLLAIAIGTAMFSGVWIRGAGIAATVLLSTFLYASAVAQTRFVPNSFVVQHGHINPVLMIRDSVPLLLTVAVTLSAFVLKKRGNTTAD